MPAQTLLLPYPRDLTYHDGTFALPASGGIRAADPALRFAADTLGAALRAYTLSDEPDAAITLTIDGAQPAQGYHLAIAADGVTIAGGDAAGVFYGVCTLMQIVQQHGTDLPLLTVRDWPDFPARGVMLDISRDRVPTMDTLYTLIDRLARFKINQVQIYMEHTFAYPGHERVWQDASPLTGAEIEALDAFCRERHVELVPNQNSLGHMERWLKHPDYRPLAECPDGWGKNNNPPTTLNPTDPASLQLMDELYAKLLPHFSSELFNVGGDEPWELGQGHSKDAVEARGGRVYLDYLLGLHELVQRRGHRMQFWTDIITKYPDLVPELPRDVMPMVWGYEADEPSAEQCAMVAAAGLEFYVCPGTSSWNSLSGRTESAIGNLRTAALNGHEHGAVGYLITDWGDHGHWQPFAVSGLGFAYGAALAWCYETNETLDLPPLLDAFVFDDRAGVLGKLAYDLGNLYQVTGPRRVNGQLLFYLLQVPHSKLDSALRHYEDWGDERADISPATLRRYIERLDAIMAPLNNSEASFTDRAAFAQVAALLRHSAERLLFFAGESDKSAATLLADAETLIERQRALWLAQHRPGGLEDSLARFEPLLADYRAAL